MDPTEKSAYKLGQSLEGKYLTFSLSGEEYGLPILNVQEIIKIMPIRTVPQVPYFMKGVINLRGKVIPVIDLRLKFGMSEMEYTERTSIIVVDVLKTGQPQNVGIVVDSVSEVITIKAEEIEGPPAFGSTMQIDYLLAMAKVNKQVKILLDINSIIGEAEELNLGVEPGLANMEAMDDV